jgi:UDP-2,4-diacetamido-2,4,6-trideoxy-beta-L-altropyranose hydrolase
MRSDLRIELAKNSDLMDVFNLSNDRVVRESSFNSQPIFLKDHIKWFEEKIKNYSNVFFIVRDKENNFVGYVRFDNYKQLKKDEYVITIHLAEQFRGKGLGPMLIKETSEIFLNDYAAFKIYAYIKKENEPSLKSFLKVGYKIVGEELISDIESYKLKYELENNGTKSFSYCSTSR